MIPYQVENGNISKMSSADLFGQVVIWNLSGKVSLFYLGYLIGMFFIFLFIENKKIDNLFMNNIDQIKLFA